ncbi:hypothetical protein HOO68_03050 [Candidatus Gracilibacteria bacterium]|nr:hypothetical protein [Candidatus Gracilibacteria bacterium]
MSKKTFNINKDIYPENIIQEAILTFVGYNIIYSDSVISIEEDDSQYIFDELMNYMLSISLENTIGA